MTQNVSQALLFADKVAVSLDVVTAVLDFGGIVGNILSFVALLHCVRSASMYIILRCLAVSDTLFLLGHLLFQLAPFYRIFPFHRITICIGYTYVANVAATITVWITVLLSIERLVAIAFPFRHRGLFAKRRTVLALIAIWLFSFLSRIPGFLQRLGHLIAKQKLGTSAYNASKPINSSATAILGRDGQTIKNLELSLWGVEAVVSVIIVFTCNAIILVKLFHHVKQWSSMRRRQQQEVKATKLPLWVIAMFLLSELPKKISRLLLQLGAVSQSYSLLLITLCDFFTVLNSSTNIVVYFACSRNARRKIVSAVVSPFKHKNAASCCNSDAHSLDCSTIGKSTLAKFKGEFSTQAPPSDEVQ